MFVKLEFELKPFDFAKATEKEWRMYHDYRYKRYPEALPGDPILADNVVEENVRNMLDELDLETQFVYLKDKTVEPVGMVRVAALKESSASYEENKHLCQVINLELLTPYRGNGIGRRLLEVVLSFAKENEKSIIVGQVTEDDGKRFIRNLKAKEALSAVENRLDLTKLDWNMVNEWVEEGPIRSPDSKIEFFQDVPEEIIEEYCRVYSEVGNQAPREDLDVGDFIVTPERRRQHEQSRKAGGGVWLTAITREPNGDISGLTEVLYMPSKDPLITQDLTGVPEKYRGSGKGKWLKAIMLQEIRKRFPTVTSVVTGNATSNAPMLSINNRLGFKPHKEVILAQITTEDLESYLRK